MKQKSSELIQTVQSYVILCEQVNEETASCKIDSDKWTAKEIIGHLIDSAVNNHHRFVRMQLSHKLQFPDYNKDEWLSVEHHNAYRFSDLLNLFKEYNNFLSHIVQNIKSDCLNNYWEVSFIEGKDSISLLELIDHFIEHMKIHYEHLEKRIIETKEYLNL